MGMSSGSDDWGLAEVNAENSYDAFSFQQQRGGADSASDIARTLSSGLDPEGIGEAASEFDAPGVVALPQEEGDEVHAVGSCAACLDGVGVGGVSRP